MRGESKAASLVEAKADCVTEKVNPSIDDIVRTILSMTPGS